MIDRRVDGRDLAGQWALVSAVSITSFVVVAVIEGIHLHEPTRDPDARDELVQWLIRRLIHPSAPLTGCYQAGDSRTDEAAKSVWSCGGSGPPSTHRHSSTTEICEL